MKEPKDMTRLVVRTMKSLLFVFLLAACPCFGAWQFQTVDDQGSHGQWCVMTLDNAGCPHIAYRDGVGNLYYARWSGSQWQVSLVDTDLDGGLVKNLDVGLGVDDTGNVHISYYDNGNIYDADGWFVAYKDDLKYAKWDGSSWSIQTLVSDNDAGEYNSLALDTNGYPHICFYYQHLTGDDNSDWFGKLQHIWWSGSGWQRETVDDPGSSNDGDIAGEHCTMVIDSSNNPHVAYAAFTYINYDYDEHLRYAVRNSGGGWTIEKVNSHIVNWETSLALGPDGTPHIAYYDYDHSDLQYARKTGGIWSGMTVDSNFGAGLWLSLAVDEENNPYIAYTDGTYNMIYAQWIAGTWNSETVDVSVLGISLVLASANNPRIAYYTTSTGSSALGYAYWTTSTQDEYTLTVDTVGNGSVTKDPDQATYSDGDTVELTAIPDDGWSFDSWSGDLSGSDNPGTITIDGDKTVTATFTLDVAPDMSVGKCQVTAGKTEGYGTIVVSGEMNAAADDLSDADSIQVTVDSGDMISPCVQTFPIDAKTFNKKGKYNYAKTESGSKKSFTYNTKTGKFSFSAKNVDLAGLGCPLTIEIEIGDYIAEAEVDEAIVNGPKKPIPIKLMMGVKNALRVDKIQVKRGKKQNSDKLTVKGAFAVEDTSVNMANEEFVVTLGTQTFTLPAGSFKAGKDKFTCKKATVTEVGLAGANFNFKTCVFTLTIKSTMITAGSGTANFSVQFADFNEGTEVLLP